MYTMTILPIGRTAGVPTVLRNNKQKAIHRKPTLTEKMFNFI